MLLKVLENEVTRWPFILQGVLFAHRTAPHASTKHSPFYIVYQREPVLPADLFREVYDENEKRQDEATCCSDIDIDEDSFLKVLKTMVKARELLHDQVHENIQEAQKKQKTQYDKRVSNTKVFHVGMKVLVRNLRRRDRKGDWQTMPWRGPFSICEIKENNIVTLLDKHGAKLKTKQQMKNLKVFKEMGHDEDFEIDIEISNRTEKEDLHPKSDNKTTSSMESNTRQENDPWSFFFPVNSVWQQKTCSKLGLTVVNPISASPGEPQKLGKPLKIVDVTGDGNCWFRCISWALTGTQQDHAEIRQKLVNFMKINSKIQAFIGQEKTEEYVRRTKMSEDGAWASEIEIFSTAILLNTDIHIYRNQDWLKFTKTGRLASRSKIDQRAIYIENVRNVHFVVVTQVEMIQ